MNSMRFRFVGSVSQNLGFGLKCRDGPYFKCCLIDQCFKCLTTKSSTIHHHESHQGSTWEPTKYQSVKVSKCLAESCCPLTTLLELSRKTERKINCHVSWLSYSVSLSLFMFVPRCHVFFLQICTLKSFSSPFLCICLLHSKQRIS